MAHTLSDAEIIKRLHEDLARFLAEERDLPMPELETAVLRAAASIDDRSNIGWIYQLGSGVAVDLSCETHDAGDKALSDRYTRARHLLWRLCTFIPVGGR